MHPSPALKFFVDLVNQGKRRGSSSGERSARKLALAFLDDGLVLDDLAMDGLIEFMRCAKCNPESARTVINGWEEPARANG